MILTVENILYRLHFMSGEGSSKKLRLTVKHCAESIIVALTVLDIILWMVSQNTGKQIWLSILEYPIQFKV